MQNPKIKYAIFAWKIIELILIIWLIQNGATGTNNFFMPKSYCQGVDISHYQGEVDMDVLAGKGIDFLYIKATEGSGYIDERYEENCRNAKNAGLLAGAYHFFSFDSDPASQAEHFIQTIGNQNGNLVPAVDVEYYGDKRENKPDVGDVRQSLQECLDILEDKYQQKPVIYTTLPFYYKYIKGKFKSYPLWIRSVNYPVGISAGRKWAFWQYDGKAVWDGYQGETKYIDRNVFHGSRKALEKKMVLKREYTYKFQACDSEKIMGATQYGFCNLYSEDTAEKHSLYIGQVIALFGEPEHQTPDNEDLFSQAVEARDKDGNVLYLEAYYGPSGPAITGYYDKTSDSIVAGDSMQESDLEELYQKAIDELAEYIMDTEPADFAWESVYGDTSVSIKMGVRNGEPYYDTILPEELMKIFMGDE